MWNSGLEALRKRRPRCGIALILAAISAAVPAAAFARPNVDVVDTIRAEFLSDLANRNSGRIRDLRIADDRRVESEERLGTELAGARLRVQSLSLEVGRLKGRLSANAAVLAAAEFALDEARHSLADVSRTYTVAVSQREDLRVALDAFQRQFAKFIDTTSPDEEEALRRFADGDNSALVIIERITDAEVAARNAATARINAMEQGRYAILVQIAQARGGATREQVASAWTKAIAADPTYANNRVLLCKSAMTFVPMRYGPREETGPASGQNFGLDYNPKDLNWANSLCSKASKSAPSLEDRVLILSVQAQGNLSLDNYPAALQIIARASALIQNAVAKNTATPGMMRPIAELGIAKGRADERLLPRPKREELRHLSRDERRERRIRDENSAKLVELRSYEMALRQIDAILAKQKSLEHDPRTWDAMSLLAEGTKEEISDKWAGDLFERVRQYASAVLVLDPNNVAARIALANALDDLAGLFFDEKAVSLSLLAAEQWRAIVRSAPSETFYSTRLANSLSAAVSEQEGSVDGQRRLTIAREIVSLRSEDAARANPTKNLTTTSALASAYGRLAATYDELGNHNMAIEQSALAVALHRDAYNIASKDPLEIAIRDDRYSDPYLEELGKFTDYLVNAGDYRRAVAATEERLGAMIAVHAKNGGSEAYDEDIEEVRRLLTDFQTLAKAQPKP